MKPSVKLLIVIFLFSFGTESFAQNFGIRAGLNLSEIHSTTTDENYDDYQRMKPGFHIGPTVEFPITNLFSFESGLLLTTKGRKFIVKIPMDNWESRSKLNLIYLDIPLTAKATFNIGSLNLYGTFGPYIGMGIGGRSKTKYIHSDETSKESVKFGSEGRKRFDYGLTAGGGIRLNNIQIGVIYSLSLTNSSSYSGDTGFGVSKFYNRVLGLSVGYGF